MKIIEVIQEAIMQQDTMDLAALLVGLLYVWWMAKGKRAGWIAGIGSCSIILWKDVFQYQLYADGALQVYYISMGVAGFAYWKRDPNTPIKLLSKIRPVPFHIGLILLGSILSFTIGHLLSGTSAALPFVDSLTSVFAVIATGLMVLRLRSNWLYWIVVDAVYIYIYSRQGAYYFALLSSIYLLLAIYGFVAWRRPDLSVVHKE